MQASIGLMQEWIGPVCVATAGTALIWEFPWGRFFPLEAMIASMNFARRLEWLIAIEVVTAAMVLPFFAVLLRLWGTFGWANLLRLFCISAILFTAIDLPVFWWNVSHPVPGGSEAVGALAWQVVSSFTTMLISALA